MYDPYDDADARQFLSDIIRMGHMDGAALGITKRVIDQGYANLTMRQRAVFKSHVEDRYVTNECSRCGNSIPWSEMYEAHHNGGYCGYCQHMWDKIERE